MARVARSPTVPRIALTGGIACGKSTVSRLFEALGARLIDTDQIARDVVAPPSPVLQALIARFGSAILAPDGTLNRAQLRQLIFSDEAARKDLEALMHPAIRAATAAQSRSAGGPYQLIAVPLLLETGTQGDYDRVLVIECDPEVQLRRLMMRDALPAPAACRMIAAQADAAARRAIAHDVIRNDGDVAALAPQVQALHQQYLALSRSMSVSADRAR